MYRFHETKTHKVVTGHDYNYLFSKVDGTFIRWGKDQKDDPAFSPIGPEILDLEISINGCPNNCSFCYKANTSEPATNMSFATFKAILDKMPRSLTQIAFGITGIQTNPDFIRMLKYCRSKGVIPNFTLSGADLTDDLAEQTSKLVGAVAVSAYKKDKNVCYNTVAKYISLGVKQTNIHLMVSKETLEFAYEVLGDILVDPRLKGLNAVVLLGLKPKGRSKGHFEPLSYEEFAKICDYCYEREIPFGMDSCSAPKFERYVREADQPEKWKKTMLSRSESCESSLFSSYINVHGQYWHCSFSENEPNVEPVDVLAAKDFLKDVWYSPAVVKFRNRVLATCKAGCRGCVSFGLE